MTVRYLITRIGLFILILWIAATVNFLLPKISQQDPIALKLQKEMQGGGSAQVGIKKMAEIYNAKFGLDQPLYKQYFRYLADTFRFRFNYSILRYPTTVSQIIVEAIPWTIGVGLTCTIISFVLGSMLGALMAWGRAPSYLKMLLPFLFTFSAIPYFLLGLIFIYIFAFKLMWFPFAGGYEGGLFPGWNWVFVLSILKHSVLPAMSIVIVSIGWWALGMRAMMITMQGEDYMIQAEAKGLDPTRIFIRYSIRNAILPQTTAFALSLGHFLSGLVLVEVIFGYPGLGNTLLSAIKAFDYFLIQGIVFTIIVSIGVSMLFIDLLYPFIDPRINYEEQG
jgi:peptide/nickel transport system permease protein